MPRFHFNLSTDNGHYADEIGMEFPSLHDALDDAVLAARGAKALAGSEGVGGTFQVADSAGRVLASVPFRREPLAD